MDIKNLNTANKGDIVILLDGRKCVVNQKIEKNILEDNSIIWKIYMKDDKYFIIDDISLKDILLHNNNWYISNSKYVVSRNEGKTLNLNQLLLPKNNTKELHVHKDGDNFNFRISNIHLSSQSLVNSKIYKKKGTENHEINEINIVEEKNDNTNMQNKTEKIGDIVDIFGEKYTITNIDLKSYLNPYIYLKHNTTNKEIIKLYCNDYENFSILDSSISNLIGIKNLYITNIKWYYHNISGYIWGTLKSIHNNEKLTLHSFVYFANNPNTNKENGFSIHHKNINKLDNRIENLEYVNQSIQNSIRNNPERITKQIAIENIKDRIPKLITYHKPKDNFGDYFEIEIKPFKTESFERIRAKSTKNKECTIIDKLAQSIIIRHQLITKIINDKKVLLSRFCLEGKQFKTLEELKVHSQTLLNELLNNFTEIKNNNYTLDAFEIYINEKSKRKANSGSFKPKLDPKLEQIQ